MTLLHESLNLNVMLQHHLRYNHYPPHPPIMIPVAEEAIRLAREAQTLSETWGSGVWDSEIWDQKIDLPQHVEMKNGRKTMTVREAFETFRLEDFLDEY